MSTTTTPASVPYALHHLMPHTIHKHTVETAGGHWLDITRKWVPRKGPWVDEVDRMQWVDKLTHLPCVVFRALPTGQWQGWVGVPGTHLLSEAEFNSTWELKRFPSLQIHGKCFLWEATILSIVETPTIDCLHQLHSASFVGPIAKQIMPKRAVGFSCDWVYDYIPKPHVNGNTKKLDLGVSTYKTFSFAVNRTRQLARRLGVMHYLGRTKQLDVDDNGRLVHTNFFKKTTQDSLLAYYVGAVENQNLSSDLLESLCRVTQHD